MNIRWDAVVDCQSRTAEVPGRAVSGAVVGAVRHAAVATVNVWLYGTLAGSATERPLRLQIADRLSTNAVIRELGQRLGEEFLGHVVDAKGRKFDHCRIFVDGSEVDNPELPVHQGPGPATVEMILLTAIEGG
ncbi:MoaD/ThiS family protein [Aromatoleum aromaticum]|uniref:Uncharacterized protein n=1 Tax=Aromatoleum aromaticum (strain DSM 19018 / LMG 30748 / EbN1) TaxID=76114 RepID=Q5P038_AROAE|nr:MoaD/ThiS family protein [Aromatoleum aromaticum]NMG54860.1 hypothetical protein [Aromatoleum aromaticum]CAI09326.1 hypothetical protein ebB198 [Aromatoleum aromaticum EbN1]